MEIFLAANFQKMKGYGVTGVVVKLTEATSYHESLCAITD